MYDIPYFIKKFEAIPECQWGVRAFQRNDGTYCALGHCGCTYGHNTLESEALCKIFANNNRSVVCTNDGKEGRGKTPKQRVLQALRSFQRARRN